MHRFMDIIPRAMIGESREGEKKHQSASVEEILSKIPVFDSLKKRELKQVASIIHHRHYAAGEYVCFQGDPGLGMYVIEEGEVSVVYVQDVGTKNQLAVLQEGNFFGEISLLDESPRSASVLATTEARLIGFFRTDLFEIMERSPGTGLKIVLKLAEMIGERLRLTNQELGRIRSELEALRTVTAKEEHHHENTKASR